VKTLPGVGEAIEQGDFEEAQEQINIIDQVLNGSAGEIERAVGIVEGER